MEIREALQLLDTMDDSHWTADGAPAIDAVSKAYGSKVTRQQIIDAAPGYSRENIVLDEVTGGEPASVEALAPTTEADLTALNVFFQDQPLTQLQFVEELKHIPTYLLPILEKGLVEQEAAAREHLRTMDDILNRVVMGKFFVRNRIKLEIPQNTNQEAIQEYLRAQHDLRAQKAAERSAILRNIDVQSLDPRSKIDQAMARRTARGNNRPVHPQR